MEIANANALIEVLVDHNQHYAEPMRRELFESVYEIADACLETIDAAGDDADETARRELRFAASMIEADLMSGNLTEGFLVAFDCFNRAALQVPKSAV